MSTNNTTDPQPAKIEVSYKITVQKIVKNFPFRNREYQNTGAIKKDQYGNDEKEYGYVYFDDEKTVTTTVYEQSLDTVELPAIIKAVNGLED